ncbi:MAG: hypoxanthine phosphoribosyltransferase [Capsulimonas sp.]|jgi:hypoxanthine phosphoribosyltransferase|nr:hypoxanthine phosphoribosyltransferase [Capsulimonas sp.]
MASVQMDLEEDVAEVLLTQEQIATRVAELGAQISLDYAGKDLMLICILKGANIFLADLVRQITIPVAYDFVAVSSYGADTKSSGVVRILKDLDESVESKHVLVVEDIVDTGLTLRLSYLLENLRSRRAASVKVCTLLDKPVRRRVDVPVDYFGFKVEDQFVVGYGLDYQGKYRSLPYIGVLKPEIYGGG